MSGKHYEEGLYRRYATGGDSWDSEEGQTHHYEYDRDEQAERNAALGAAVATALEAEKQQPVAEQVHAMFDRWSLEDNAALGRIVQEWSAEAWEWAATQLAGLDGLAAKCKEIAAELRRQEAGQ